MGMATCKQLQQDVGQYAAFPKDRDDWVAELQHELDILRKRVRGDRVRCPSMRNVFRLLWTRHTWVRWPPHCVVLNALPLKYHSLAGVSR
eukprot:2391648-Rhodomonas_salina.1